MSAEAWFLDSSALVKTVVEEPESGAVREWLRDKDVLVACELVRVEVVRAVRLHDPDAVADARRRLSTLSMIRVDRALYDAAAGLDPPLLRSLDALHLAAALSVGSALSGMVTYDVRMAGAARGLGFRVEAPA